MNENIIKHDFKVTKNKIKTFLQKPDHIILLVFGILLSFATIVPMITLLNDTFVIKPGSYSQCLIVYF